MQNETSGSTWVKSSLSFTWHNRAEAAMTYGGAGCSLESVLLRDDKQKGKELGKATPVMTFIRVG